MSLNFQVQLPRSLPCGFQADAPFAAGQGGLTTDFTIRPSIGSRPSSFFRPSTFGLRTSSLSAFTLIEIMVVVVLILIMMSIGVPIVYRALHRPPLPQAVTELLEVFATARSRAILHSQSTAVLFHPQSREFGVAGGGGAHAVQGAVLGTSGAVDSGHFPEGVAIEMLDIDLSEYKDADEAKVLFYPDGRCSELLLILRADDGEQRGISLEVTTGLATVLNETDLQNLRR